MYLTFEECFRLIKKIINNLQVFNIINKVRVMVRVRVRVRVRWTFWCSGLDPNPNPNPI